MQEDFVHFLMNHWELTLAFLLILIYWISAEIMAWQSTLGITPAHLVHLMNRENATVIDLRDPTHFEKSHILGALNFPEKTLFEKVSVLKKYSAKPVILVDVQGSIASKIINKFIAQGFEKAHYLKGGLNSWVQEKLPLEFLHQDGGAKKGVKQHGKR